MLNVSYDPTRELFQDLNKQFEKKYQRETGKTIVIQQSHGGSTRQARAALPQMELFPVTILAKDWNDAQQKFFGENGIFDGIGQRREKL